MPPGTSAPAEAAENVSGHVGPIGFWVFIYSLETVPLKLNLRAAYEDKLTKRAAFVKHHCVLHPIGMHLLTFVCNGAMVSSFCCHPQKQRGKVVTGSISKQKERGIEIG